LKELQSQRFFVDESDVNPVLQKHVK
jgi:hypothetical protein